MTLKVTYFGKKTGDQVTIKTVENPAEKHMRTRVVSYQRLLQDYYQTSQQQQEVKDDANRLKDCY